MPTSAWSGNWRQDQRLRQRAPGCRHLAMTPSPVTNMYLVQILLPLRDSKGRGFPSRAYDDVAHHLTEHFGGVTSFTRSPAEGRWKPSGAPASEEDIVVFEVMVEDLDDTWWRRYRRVLEKAFKQKSIVVRAHEIRKL